MKKDKDKVNHGWSGTKTHQAWADMLQRCNNPNNTSYKNYGSRGITVCSRWNYFENFLDDMGSMPERLTLERLDNDEGYNPENCRWRSRTEQNYNKRAGKKSRSGYPGVTYSNRDKRWLSSITIKGKKIYLGCFKTMEDAIAARIAGEEKHLGKIRRLDSRIPKKIDVGGKVFSVRYPYKFLERSDVYARVIFDENLILVGDASQSGGQSSKDHQWATFFHELIHVCDHEFCNDVLGTEVDKEIIVDALGKALSRILTLNFYMIPKK